MAYAIKIFKKYKMPFSKYKVLIGQYIFVLSSDSPFTCMALDMSGALVRGLKSVLPTDRATSFIIQSENVGSLEAMADVQIYSKWGKITFGSENKLSRTMCFGENIDGKLLHFNILLRNHLTN